MKLENTSFGEQSPPQDRARLLLVVVQERETRTQTKRATVAGENTPAHWINEEVSQLNQRNSAHGKINFDPLLFSHLL